MRTKLVVIVLALLLAACPQKPAPAPKADATEWENACDVLKHYGCKVAEPNERGETCAKRFERIEGPGYMPQRASCIVSRRASLEGVESCGVGCD